MQIKFLNFIWKAVPHGIVVGPLLFFLYTSNF